MILGKICFTNESDLQDSYYQYSGSTFLHAVIHFLLFSAYRYSHDDNSSIVLSAYSDYKITRPLVYFFSIIISKTYILTFYLNKFN